MKLILKHNKEIISCLNDHMKLLLQYPIYH